MANRTRTEAYTLVELMIVVVIIGVVAGIAAPRLNQQLVDRRTNEVQLDVVRYFRQARSMAVGHGAVTRVIFDGAGRGSLSLALGDTSRCNTTRTWTAQTTYNPTNLGRAGSPVTLALVSPALTYVELCFNPTGVTSWRSGTTGRFNERMTAAISGGLMFTVTGTTDSGVARRVLLPFGSDARVFR